MLIQSIHRWLRSVLAPSLAAGPKTAPSTREASSWMSNTQSLGTDALGTRWVLDLSTGRVRAMEPTGTLPSPQDWIASTQLNLDTLAEALRRGGHVLEVEEDHAFLRLTPEATATLCFLDRMLLMLVSFAFHDDASVEDRRSLVHELNSMGNIVRWICGEESRRLIAAYEMPHAAGVSVQQLLVVIDEFSKNVQDGITSESAEGILRLR